MLATRTFRDAFVEFNTEEDMRRHCEAHFNPVALSAVMEDPMKVFLVAERGENLCAYAQLHLGEACSFVPATNPVELHRFYILREWQGRGLAKELLARSVDFALRRGADLLWLGVWENNPRAIRFYEKSGFKTVGDKEFMLGHDRQRDLVMSLDLPMS